MVGDKELEIFFIMYFLITAKKNARIIKESGIFKQLEN